MSRIGIAVAESTGIGSLLDHGIVDLPTDGRGANGHIGRGQLLGKGHHIRRLDTHGVATKIAAGTTKTSDHFVSPKHDAVAIEHRLNLLVIAIRGHYHAAGAGDGLGDKCRDGFRPLGHYHGL